MSKQSCLLFATAALFLSSGCGTFRDSPKPSYSVNVKETRNAIEDARQRYHATDGNMLLQRQARNKYITERLRLLDHDFARHVTRLSSNDRAFSTLSTLTILGTGAAGGVVSEGASQLLSASSAGVAGAQDVWGEKVLLERTSSALVNEMRANRDEVKAKIFVSLPKNTAIYPIAQADAHLEELANAARLSAGAAALDEQSAQRATTASEGLNAVIATVDALDVTSMEEITSSLALLPDAQLSQLVELVGLYTPRQISTYFPAGKTSLDELTTDEFRRLYINLVLMSSSSQLSAWSAKIIDVSKAAIAN